MISRIHREPAGRLKEGTHMPEFTRSRDHDRSDSGHVYFGDVRLDIAPSFENDSNMVSAPPGQLASADRSKVVERDEKIYRKKPEFI